MRDIQVECPFCNSDKEYLTTLDLAALTGKSSAQIKKQVRQNTFPIYTFLMEIRGRQQRVATKYAVDRYYHNLLDEDFNTRAQDELQLRILEREEFNKLSREKQFIRREKLKKEKLEALALEQAEEEEDAEENSMSIEEAIKAQEEKERQELLSKKVG